MDLMLLAQCQRCRRGSLVRTLRHGCKIIAKVIFADGCTKKKDAQTWKLVGYDEMAFWG